MCGIAGFNWQEKDIIAKMTHSIRHRGPDDEGFYIDNNVSLGHRRLSILDVSPKGHQPMHFAHLTIVYNGEIYNFLELKEQLKAKGYHFSTGTDTEVLLASYHFWGEQCVERFNGMWAFCIYDKKANKLFLSRDRFGVKPLYYYFDGDKFIFASELKAVRQHQLNLKINISALNFYFYQKYISGELTIFENCFKLKPSENLVFDLGRKTISKYRYFNLEEEISAASEIPLKERLLYIENTLVDSVEKRLIADVPVGSFLSGGLDSSLISAIIAARKKDFDTFTIGFKDSSYDEVPYSELASEYLGTNHHVQYMDIDESLIEYIISKMDEPFGDSSILPTYLLSKMAREKVTVSLSGDAGDEVFGGYDTYRAYNFASYVPKPLIWLAKPIVNQLPISDGKLTRSFKVKRFVNQFGSNIIKRHLDWMSTFINVTRKALLTENFIPAESFINFNKQKGLLAIQLNDMCNYLPGDILKKVDMASMLNSLEAREPYLDYRLVPQVLSLPENYRVRIFTTKWLLKKIALSYLPGKIVRRKKRGFTVPISRLIKHSRFIRDFILDYRNYDRGLLNYDYIKRIFYDHINHREDNARQLWLIFVFNYWWDLNIRKSK